MSNLRVGTFIIIAVLSLSTYAGGRHQPREPRESRATKLVKLVKQVVGLGDLPTTPKP